MDSFRALITSYGLSDFAADIGVHENTAKQMRKRDSVAPEYWDAWVQGAEARTWKNITYERLAKIAAAKRTTHQIGDAPDCAASGTRQAKRDLRRATSSERAKPLRCISSHGSAGLATEGQSR